MHPSPHRKALEGNMTTRNSPSTIDSATRYMCSDPLDGLRTAITMFNMLKIIPIIQITIVTILVILSMGNSASLCIKSVVP